MNWLSIPYAFWIALTYVGVALTFVAGLLAARAVRGTPAGWQPTCRRCGHDLRGVEPGKAGCPECGADLMLRGAVRTGRHVRSAGSVAAAATTLVLALAALWFLSPSKVLALRAACISSMKVEGLVDVVVWGGSRPDDRDLAASALWSRLGPNVGGLVRTIPSGELLDALLAAFARCDEPGRVPLAALLSAHHAATLLNELDEAERLRLVELATEEIIASKGQKIDLARCVAAIDVWPPGGGQTPLVQLAESLRATEAGREAISPKLIVKGATEAGGEIALEVVGPLDQLFTTRMSRGSGPRDVLVLESAEAVPENGEDKAEPRRLRETGGPSTWRGDESEQPALIADLAPGRYLLRVTGVLAPRTLLPRSEPFRSARGNLTIDDAAKLEGARPYDDMVSIEVRPPNPSGDPIERLADPVILEPFEIWMKGARIQTGDMMLELGEAPSIKLESGRDLGYAFSLTVRQDGAPAPFGSIAGSKGGRGTNGSQLPSSIDTKRPFEIVLAPDLTTETARDQFRNVSNLALFWARCTLRFESANRAPAVVCEPLPLDPIASSVVPRDEARELVARVATSIGESAAQFRGWSRLGRWRASSDFTIGFSVAPVTSTAKDTDTGTPVANAPVTMLSGAFELLLDGNLAAPVQHEVWVLDGNRQQFSMLLAHGLETGAPYTLRYRPDASIAQSKMASSIRTIEEPFELRFTDASKPPEVVWPESTK